MEKELGNIIKSYLEPISLDPFSKRENDYKSLIKMAENTRFVLIGESTHGTKEFYQIRAEITKKLIGELGFNAVAIEGDWPDAYQINRYVNNLTVIGPTETLAKFERFPTWMWQNKEVLSFIKWLHVYNLIDNNKIGFYGLDLYSTSTSIAAVIEYLEKIDKEAAKRARERYKCMDNFMPSSFSFKPIDNSCEEQVIKQLSELRQKAFEYIKKDNLTAEEEFFFAEQNAILIKDYEEYYRSLYYGEQSSWNLRDLHMAKTLDNLSIHLEKIQGKPSKIVVWAHNSHIGDASATDMGKERNELNLGQLVREKYGKESLLIGFSTYQGTVSAASNWDMPVERKTVIPALAESVEALFHQTKVGNFILNFRDSPELSNYLDQPLLQRFIGVIYLPKTERLSHYYYAHISKQFDALVYLNDTSAVEPLQANSKWHKGEVSETYPFGM